MPQSSTIAFYLVAGFLIYVTAKGELPVYLSVFLGAQPANQPSPSDANATPKTAGNSLAQSIVTPLLGSSAGSVAGNPSAGNIFSQFGQ